MGDRVTRAPQSGELVRAKNLRRALERGAPPTFIPPDSLNPVAQPPDQTLPEGYKASCFACHDEHMMRQQRLTRAQWDREIGKMTGWGAKVKDEDRTGLLDYLFTNYGPRPRNR